MKVITTNRLNRFWKNGVLPIKNALETKLNTSSVVNNLLTTAAGYALDARQGKALDDKITALNGKSIIESGSNSRGHYRKYADGTLEMWGEAGFTGVNISQKDNWNYCSGKMTVSMPSTSKTQLIINATARDGNGAWLAIPDTGVGYDKFLAWIYASSSVTSANAWIMWHAFGTWK